MKASLLSAAMAAAAFRVVSAQTSTDCNPLTNSTCPSDAALGKTISVDFTSGESSYFTAVTGTTITYGTNGAEFTMTDNGLAKTVDSNFYIFFGKVEVTLRAANGTGIVSSFVMESDDLDEIDWEWLGGDATEAETNYFGKGNTTSYDRATYPTVDDPQDTWHTYLIDWTAEYVKWYIDGTLVRTLLYADAVSGTNFPQTPMKLKIGVWDGGAADESTGTVEWAGGYSDLTLAPFTMYVKNVTIEDYTTNGTTYSYGDMTGDWQSIIISNDTTTTTSSSSSSSSTSSSASSSTSGSNSGSKSSSGSSTSGSLSNGTSTSNSTSSSATPSVSLVTASFGPKQYSVGMLPTLVGLGFAILL